MEYTLVNATIVDGTGKPGYAGDLMIQQETITAIGQNLPHQGQVIDLHGHVLSPGFIDMHSHTALLGLTDLKLEAKTRQGITTEATGPDGYSPAPLNPGDVGAWRTHLSGLEGDPPLDWSWRSFGDYRERLRGTSTNWAPMVGHGNLRLAVMGMANRPASAGELDQMCDLLDASFQEGAFALSTGLVYTPQAYAGMEELVALGRVAARYGRFFDFHMRTEGEHLLRGIEEVLEVGRQSGCHIHICHFKLGARPMWGKLDQAAELIESTRRSGLQVTCDQYPYTAGSTMLAAMIPPWAHEGGPERLRERLQSKSDWPRLERDALEGLPGTWESRLRRSGAENIYISSVRSEANQSVVGRNLAQIGADWGVSPFEAVVRLLLEEDFAVGMIVFWGTDSDVEAVMRLPWQMFCTDAVLIGKPHPRAYGTYPRIFGHFVREKGVLSLEEAVQKCTSIPASTLGLKDRGVLEVGKAADAVVFDPERIADRATYEDPRQYPQGISYVFVNGQMVISDGEHTGAFPGRAL